MNNVSLVGKINFKKSYEKFTSFQLSTHDGWGDNKKWNNHLCKVFGGSKKFVDEYINDGDIISVTGSIDYSKHEDKIYTNILVKDIKSITNDNKNKEQYVNTDEKPSYKTFVSKDEPIEDEDIPF